MKKETPRDVVIVGAGLYGAVCAYELSRRGYRCAVVEKQNHIGGNCYTEKRDDIHVHMHGAHIFHTSNQAIWDWISQFAAFNPYRHRVRADYNGTLYSFPPNLATFEQLWGVTTEQGARSYIESQCVSTTGDSLEDYALSHAGTDIYNIFIKDYSRKQWGRAPSELPASIIKRLPLRFTRNEDYFDDTYQGIPKGGYTAIIEKLLVGSAIYTGTDYLANRTDWDASARKIVFTGALDAFCNHRFGRLEYRSMRFEHRLYDMPDYQGCAVINYTSADVPYTRIIEHKHFDPGKQPVTWISKEYPQAYNEQSQPMYPIRDMKNLSMLKQYEDYVRSDEFANYYFGGRLAEYAYYDMHQIIGAALKKAETIACDLQA